MLPLNGFKQNNTSAGVIQILSDKGSYRKLLPLNVRKSSGIAKCQLFHDTIANHTAPASQYFSMKVAQ